MIHINKVLIFLIVSLSITLLIGLRFDMSWAGGEGFEQHAIVTGPNGQQFNRGQIISWIDVDMIHVGESEVWIDKNTEVKIINSIPGQEVINIIQGRVVIVGNLTIEVRELDVHINGTASYVHYSWLDEIEITSINGSAKLQFENLIEDISGKALRAKTLAPYELLKTEFNPETSSASEFYKKVLE